jgi:hypothetical protein
MPKIQINEFKGIMPKVANDKLPINMAQIANDIKTATGELRAFRNSAYGDAVSGSSYKSLFEYLEGGNNHWVYFDEIVNGVRAPASDTFERMYMTGHPATQASGTITFTNGMTDGETVTVGAETFEFDISEDGVGGGNTLVGDSTTTTALLCAAALAALTPAAAVTFTDNLDGTVTVQATSAGVAGNTIAFSNSGAHITTDQYGLTNFLGGTKPGLAGDEFMAYANNILSTTFDRVNDVYRPGADSAAALSASYTNGGSAYRAYFYTYVSIYGEEGPPSAIVETIDSAGDPEWDGSSSIVLSGFVRPDEEDRHLLYPNGSDAPAIRIYRTSTDGAGNSAFLLVAEIAVDATGPNSTAWASYNFTDTSNDAQDGLLGSACESALYDRCPDGLTGLRGHPGGFFVAFKDNVLYFSESFAPWAWPEDYQIPLDQEIVGVGIFGSTIVVTTDGWCYTFAGPHPASLYKTKLAFQPSLSQRAVVETDDGVMFPSPEGFQMVTAGGITNVTREAFRPEDWDNYELDTMHGVWYNKAYYGFYKSADYEGHLIIDSLNGAITSGVGYHLAGYVSISGGTFYTIVNSNIDSPGTYYVSEWDADDTSYRNYMYKSPLFVLEKPHNFKVAQVILDTDFYNDVLDIISDNSTLATLNNTAWTASTWGEEDLFGPINGSMINLYPINGDNLYSLATLGVQDYVDFKIYADGVLKFTKQVSDSNMFKLPRGFKDKKWEIEMVGMLPVKRVTIATSTEEIV